MAHLSVAQTAALGLFFVIALRFLKPFIVKSSLSVLPGPPSASLLTGNLLQLVDRQGWSFHAKLAKDYGSAVRVHGLLGEQQLYIFDPLALHHIFIKDQYTFEETDLFIAFNALVFGCSLLSSLGDHHRRQRKILNPVFSPKHLRGLIPVFYPIAHRLRDVLSNLVRTQDEDIDVMKWMTRAALEYVGQGGIGYSFDALDETKVNSYSDTIKMLGPASFGLIRYQFAIPWLMKLGPAWFRRAIVDLYPSKTVHTMRDIIDVMDSTTRNLFEKKKKALAEGDEAVVNQVGGGRDMMSVLLNTNTKADENEKLSEDELIAQMNSLVLSGQETTASAISRALYVLAEHPDVQQKLRDEVTEARTRHGDLDYDMLMALPYLDAVCREVLRVFPPASSVIRVVRKDVVLPLLWPVKSADGMHEISSIPLKKDSKVFISILNSNLSTRVWGPDAEEFKPERWLTLLPESVATAHLPGVYASMMTFIGGRRACIGFKFAEMEMKLALSVLLETFVFSLGSQEIIWSMGGIQAPTVKGSNDFTPQLPMKVSFVKDN